MNLKQKVLEILSKEAVTIENYKKQLSERNIKIVPVVIFDRSGSTDSYQLYKKKVGSNLSIMEAALASIFVNVIGISQLDSINAAYFHDKVGTAPNITLENLDYYISTYIMSSSTGGTMFSDAFKWAKERATEILKTDGHFPQFILITDGQPSDQSNATKMAVEIANSIPMQIKVFHVGPAKIEWLETMDDYEKYHPGERLVDNFDCQTLGSDPEKISALDYIHMIMAETIDCIDSYKKHQML